MIDSEPCSLNRYLQATEIVDFHAPDVRTLAESLRGSDPLDAARSCFEWVRDEVRHSLDHGDEQVTLKASDVLRERTGLCYAKSHLLAALLRANGIPCGFVYQRLALDETGSVFCLHGLNAIWIAEHSWYRVDARGNRPGIATGFNPPCESLAFTTQLPGEGISDVVYAEPLQVVVKALLRHTSIRELSRQLPDVDPCQLAAPKEF
jgi:transglutaminase-like putative cysteine protease